MGLTRFTFDGLLAHFYGMFRRLRWASARHSCSAAARCVRPAALHMQAGRAHVACAPAHQPAPLRVLRVVDNCHPPSSAGRMVISGRMADVCAELDRLAALETAAS